MTPIPVKKIKLSNTATLLIEENHATPIVAWSAYFQGSVRAESEKESGLTYFTQRMLLKGTKKFTAEELAFRTEAIGCELSLFTERDAFGLYTAILSKHIEEGLSLFMEALFHPTFPPEEVEKERQLILAEIQHSHDELYAYCLELCDKGLFTAHPYRFPRKGLPESVLSITRDDLARWHQTWYSPDNLVFSVVGDVSTEHIADSIIRALEARPHKAVPVIQPPPQNGRAIREIAVEREKRQLTMAIGFLAPDAQSDDRFPFEVLNGLLSGMGSRLFMELRDKRGLAYSIGSSYDATLDHGILKTYMGTAAEKEKAAREGLLEELWRLRGTLPDADELERTKRNLIGLYEIARQKNSTTARRYARYESLGLGWRTANQYPKKIEEVQASEVARLATRYLIPEQYAYAVVRPKMPVG